MSSEVAIYAPDGTLGSVPYEQMQAALKAGGKIAQHMTAPDGTPGYVPADRVQDALKAGGKIVPITDSPDQTSKPGFWDAAKSDAAGFVQGLASGGSPFDVGGAVKKGAGLAQDYAARQAEGRSPLYNAAATAVSETPIMNTRPMEESANAGDAAGVLGHTVVPVAQAVAPLAGEGLLRAGSAAREGIGGAIHTPEGELTPGASLTGKVAGGAAGAAIGSTIGHEYIGAMAGYKLGPSLMDRLFPEPAEQVAARSNFQNTQQIAEAQEAAIKEDAQRTNAQRIATKRAVAAEQASRDQLWQARDSMAQDLMTRQAVQDKLDAADVRAANAAARSKRQMQDDIDNGYIQKGQDLMNRQKQQDALDQEASRAAKEAQDARDQHAQDLMNRQKQQDALDAQHAQSLAALEKARQTELSAQGRFRQQGEIPQGNPTPFGASASPSEAAPMTGSPQDLISRTKKLVVPGEAPSAEDLKRAGDFTQVPLARLKLLSSWGDKLAQNEIIRRQRNQ